MSNSVARLAVFGNPIAHSLSPLIHEFFAKKEGRAISYEKRKVEGDFASCAREFFLEGGIGCNVTVPCKIEAFEFVDDKSVRALMAQAVNTIVVYKSDNAPTTYWGDNTDGAGLLGDLVRLKCPLAATRILIIGAGGAARGIVPALQLMGQMHSITIVNRTKEKAEELITSVQDFFQKKLPERALKPMRAASFAELNAADVTAEHHFDVILNATSLSMSETLPDLKADYYRRALFAYDLFYTPEGKTVFTEYAKDMGIAASFDGLGMLVGQAAEAYAQWFHTTPEIEPTLDYMRSVLKER